MKKVIDEKILCGLLQTGTVDGAAKLAEVSRSTVYSRLSDLDFRAEYDKRRTAALDAATAALQNCLMAAVDTVREILDDPTNAPQIRLNVAALLLQNGLKYSETIELIKKVETLEKNFKTFEEEKQK